MTLTGLHRATDAAAKRNMEQIVKWSKEEKLGIITKVLRQANWESSTGGGQPVPPGFRGDSFEDVDQPWSFKSDNADEVIEWILESLPPGEERESLGTLLPHAFSLSVLIHPRPRE